MQQPPESAHASSREDVTRLYRRFGPIIFARCRRTLGNEALAEQATVEVFGRTWRRLEGDAGPLWLAAVGRQVCDAMLRQAPS